MIQQDDDGRVVHFPANPDKFQFDSEVSAVFPDMARRAIPNFEAAHAAHASMLAGWLNARSCSILDIGASRGAFFASLYAAHPDLMLKANIELAAIDNSQTMCELLRADFPTASVLCADIISPTFMDLQERSFDVVCANYVLQFVPEAYQAGVLAKMIRLVRSGGVFIYGHKAKTVGGELGVLANEEYIKFRLGNGYTREEIEAKTRALQNSMFPVADSVVRTALSACSEVQETFRFMMFNTYFCIK